MYGIKLLLSWKQVFQFLGNRIIPIARRAKAVDRRDIFAGRSGYKLRIWIVPADPVQVQKNIALSNLQYMNLKHAFSLHNDPCLNVLDIITGFFVREATDKVSITEPKTLHGNANRSFWLARSISSKKPLFKVWVVRNIVRFESHRSLRFFRGRNGKDG